MIWTIEIDGAPVPQGSKVQFKMQRGGKDVWVLKDDDDRLGPWRRLVGRVARNSDRPEVPLDIPVICRIEWYRARKKSHYNIRKTMPITLKPDALQLPSGDVDKVARGILDALTGIWWTDDTLVRRLEVEKTWVPFGQREFVRVTCELYVSAPDIDIADLSLVAALMLAQEVVDDTLHGDRADAVQQLIDALDPYR